MLDQKLHTVKAENDYPKITVITVGLNVENVIERTLKSVLEQTLPPYEYLIIDGASTDNSVQIARSFDSMFTQKGVKYTIISEKDKSVHNAMNKGLKFATGDFIAYLNAGDWYVPDALEKVVAFYKEEPFDLTYGGLHYIMPNGKIYNKMSRLDHFPVSSRNWNHPSMFLRRELYQRRSGAKIRVMQEVITNYPTGGCSNNPSIKSSMERAAEKYRAYRKNGYSVVYWLESYGWELLKNVIMRIHGGRS